jgi:hypothetical protein
VQSPIIVRIVESQSTGWWELLVGSAGLAGAIALAALVGGLLMGALLFWIRSRSL